MAIVYCMAYWAEEHTEYIALNEKGEWFWTPFLEQALLVTKPFKGKEPPHCFWLPVFDPSDLINIYRKDSKED